jgi:hypothetical protein
MKILSSKIVILAVFIIGLALGALISIGGYKLLTGSPLDQLYNLYNNKGVSQQQLARIDVERQIEASLTFKDPLLERWKQYYEKILFEDIELREYAASLAINCASADKECQLTEIYSYIVKNYKYFDDPRFRDFIQSVDETMQLKGGDCEDLTILLNSLLENIGIKTYMVVTEDHVYSLACNLNKPKLSSQILNGTASWYNVNTDQCVVLDATAGQNSYIGYEPYKGCNKTAIDSVTNKYFKLP